MTREFKGIWIPREIWLNNDLGILEKVLLAEIDSLEGKKGCFASNQYFAEFLGVAKGTVANMLSALSKKGYLNITSENGANRKIFIHSLVKGVHSEMKGGSSTNEGGVNCRMKGGSLYDETDNKEDKIAYNKADSNTPPVGDAADFADFENQIEAGQSVLVTEILEFFNSTTGRKIEVKGDKAKKSRDAVAKLLKKKYTADEIKDVILLKNFEWGRNPKMAIYVQPSTLFGGKFQSYLELCNSLKSNPDLATKFKAKVNAESNTPGELISQQSLTNITARILDDLANGRDL